MMETSNIMVYLHQLYTKNENIWLLRIRIYYTGSSAMKKWDTSIYKCFLGERYTYD